MMDQIAAMSPPERVGEAMKRSLPFLGPQARAEVEGLLTPESLAAIAAVLGVWVGSHFVGVGEIVDIVLLVVGVAVIGLAVFDGIEELLAFGSGALKATTDAELDTAARHFAKAVSILGVQTVLAVLFRGVPKTWRGGRINPGAPPRFATGRVSRPPLRSSRAMPAGDGSTRVWGDITISRLGSKTDRRLVALHEAVHRALTPRLSVLRQFRVGGRAASYARSPLSKYLEEALAETVAQVGVNGIRSVFTGISFPVTNGYVTLLRKGVSGGRILYPVIPELSGLVVGGFLLGGDSYEIRFSAGLPVPNQAAAQ
jgi:hypothetical protein